MKGVVKVVTPEEFILWKAKQKAKYLQVFPEKDPSAPPAGTDSAQTKPAAPPVAVNR